MDDNFIDYNSLSSLDLKKYEVIYNKNLNKFSNLIDKLASCYKEDLSWLVQSVLSKNKSLSNVYFEYCKLEILKIRLKKNFYNKIIVNDKAQKKLIEANFSNNFTLEFIIKKTSTNVYLNVIKNLILNIKFGFILFMN